ncbi:MAG: hypothetical protein ACRDOI_11665 [Trebonia sp.]
MKRFTLRGRGRACGVGLHRRVFLRYPGGPLSAGRPGAVPVKGRDLAARRISGIGELASAGPPRPVSRRSLAAAELSSPR